VGLDCLLFARVFVERCTQRPGPLSMSEVRTIPGGRVAYCDTGASVAQCEMQSHAATLHGVVGRSVVYVKTVCTDKSMSCSRSAISWDCAATLAC
jgi:hypothetical protein